MYIQIECASHSDTILFAGSELKHYLSKVNNFLSFSSDTMNSGQQPEKNPSGTLSI